MANGLRIALSEVNLAAGAGDFVTTRCTVYNTSLIVDEYRLQVSGVDPSWVESPEATSRIFPEAFETVTITFRPPRSAVVASGAHPFTITAISVDNPSLTDAVSGVLTVGHFIDFVLELASPRQSTGEVEGTYVVRVANAGNAQLILSLGASDDAGALTYTFDEPRLRLAPDEERQVRLVARPREVRLDTSGMTHQITITAVVAEVEPHIAVDPDLGTRAVLVVFQHAPVSGQPPRLEPERVELEAQSVRTSVVLTNRSAVPSEVALAAADKAQALAFEFLGGPRVSIPAGQTLRVPLQITCLDRTRLAQHPAVTAFTVTATPIEPAGEPRSVQGELALPAAADVRLRLDPEWVQWLGQDTRTNVVLANRSGRPVTVSLEADDKANALAFEFVGGARSAIPAEQSVEVPLRISCPDITRLPSGGTVFTVTATPIEPAGEPRSVQGELALPGPPDFRPWLEPERVHGNGPEQVRLIVANLSHRAATFVVSTRCRDAGLVVSADTTRIEIAAQGQVSVPILLTPRGTAPSLGPRAEPHTSGFVVRVAPVDAPTTANEVSGSYVFTTAKLAMRLQPKEVEAVGAAAYAVRLENGGDGDVAVELEAADQTGACALAFDRPRLTIPPRASAQVRLVVTAPPEHAADARWPFEVLARPTAPPGDVVRDEGTLVYRPPELGLGLVPPEHRSRRPCRFVAALHNPTGARILAQLAVVGSGDLEVRLPRAVQSGPIVVPPNGTVDVPLDVTPRRRSANGSERSATFAVTAASVSPPGAVRTAQGQFVILPSRRWPSLRWPLLLALLAALGALVRADVVDLGEAVLLLGPLVVGLVLRRWRWVVVCVAAFTALVLALSIDDSAAETLRLSPSASLDEVLGIEDGDLVSDVRKTLPPDAPDKLPRVGDDSVSDTLERSRLRAQGSLDLPLGELLDDAAVIAALAAAGVIVGKGVGYLIRRAHT